MFENSLYRIKETCGNRTVIALDPGHAIYKAHFPGSPVTPGVCIIQIADELTARMTGKRLRTLMIKDVKFLNILVPEKDQDVVWQLTAQEEEDGKLQVRSVVTVGETLIAKLNIIYAIL